jgi:hypothetical protein
MIQMSLRASNDTPAQLPIDVLSVYIQTLNCKRPLLLNTLTDLLEAGQTIDVDRMLRNLLSFAPLKTSPSDIDTLRDTLSALSVPAGTATPSDVNVIVVPNILTDKSQFVSVNGDASTCSVNGDASTCSVNGDASTCSVNGDASTCSVNGDASTCSVNGDDVDSDAETVVNDDDTENTTSANPDTETVVATENTTTSTCPLITVTEDDKTFLITVLRLNAALVGESINSVEGAQTYITFLNWALSTYPKNKYEPELKAGIDSCAELLSCDDDDDVDPTFVENMLVLAQKHMELTPWICILAEYANTYFE